MLILGWAPRCDETKCGVESGFKKWVARMAASQSPRCTGAHLQQLRVTGTVRSHFTHATAKENLFSYVFSKGVGIGR